LAGIFLIPPVQAIHATYSACLPLIYIEIKVGERHETRNTHANNHTRDSTTKDNGKKRSGLSLSSFQKASSPAITAAISITDFFAAAPSHHCDTFSSAGCSGCGSACWCSAEGSSNDADAAWGSLSTTGSVAVAAAAGASCKVGASCDDASC